MTARGRPVIVAWLVILAATQLPYLKAALDPPPGTTFLGAFHWLDDLQNYLSFAQQAEDGHFVFVNKLYPQPHAPAMISPEFWLVGRLSALLGQRPFLAFRLLGILAAFALVAALDRILGLAGLPEAHRLPALVLVTTGGGLGGFLFLFSDFDVSHCLDLSSGLFPFVAFLSNPHWTVATAMLLWSLLLFASEARGALACGVALANVLALTRPYEPILLVGTLALAALREPRLRRRVIVLVIGLLPWAAYQLWLSMAVPAFSFYARLGYPAFPVREALFALGPAALLALFAYRAGGDAAARPMRRRLAFWAVLASLVLCIRRPGAQSQMLVGVGLPLLALGAIGLSRWRPLATWVAAALFSGTATVAVWIVLRGDPHWHVPKEQLLAAVALRPLCQPGDVVFAPPDIGLHVNALTRCRASLSHRVAPEYAARLAQAAAFYGSQEPERRRAVLDDACVSHVVLPGLSDERPLAWLGPETNFRRSAVVDSGPRVLSIHSRPGSGCAPAKALRPE